MKLSKNSWIRAVILGDGAHRPEANRENTSMRRRRVYSSHCAKYVMFTKIIWVRIVRESQWDVTAIGRQI